MVVTLPLIPVFMALVGMATRAHTDRQFRTLQVLSGHFLDVVSGLTTLKIFGRSRAQVGVIGEVTDRYRRRLMATLRVTFLSSLVLELLASVSVALIAVAIGLRLLNGHIDLRVGIVRAGARPRGLSPAPPAGGRVPRQRRRPERGRAGLRGARPASFRPAAAAPTSPTRPPAPWPSTPSASPTRAASGPPWTGSRSPWNPARCSLVTGPSGCGKSTLLAILLGFRRPTAEP